MVKLHLRRVMTARNPNGQAALIPDNDNRNSNLIFLHGITRLGRSSEQCNVLLNSGTAMLPQGTNFNQMISRKHTDIFHRINTEGKDEYWIFDLSLNGTYVNDVRLPTPLNKKTVYSNKLTKLKEGDMLKLGHMNGSAIREGQYAPQAFSVFTFIVEKENPNTEYLGFNRNDDSIIRNKRLACWSDSAVITLGEDLNECMQRLYGPVAILPAGCLMLELHQQPAKPRTSAQENAVPNQNRITNDVVVHQASSVGLGAVSASPSISCPASREDSPAVGEPGRSHSDEARGFVRTPMRSPTHPTSKQATVRVVQPIATHPRRTPMSIPGVLPQAPMSIQSQVQSPANQVNFHSPQFQNQFTSHFNHMNIQQPRRPIPSHSHNMSFSHPLPDYAAAYSANLMHGPLTAMYQQALQQHMTSLNVSAGTSSGFMGIPLNQYLQMQQGQHVSPAGLLMPVTDAQQRALQAAMQAAAAVSPLLTQHNTPASDISEPVVISSSSEIQKTEPSRSAPVQKTESSKPSLVECDSSVPSPPKKDVIVENTLQAKNIQKEENIEQAAKVVERQDEESHSASSVSTPHGNILESTTYEGSPTPSSEKANAGDESDDDEDQMVDVELLTEGDEPIQESSSNDKKDDVNESKPDAEPDKNDDEEEEEEKEEEKEKEEEEENNEEEKEEVVEEPPKPVKPPPPPAKTTPKKERAVKTVSPRQSATKAKTARKSKATPPAKEEEVQKKKRRTNELDSLLSNEMAYKNTLTSPKGHRRPTEDEVVEKMAKKEKKRREKAALKSPNPDNKTRKKMKQLSDESSASSDSEDEQPARVVKNLKKKKKQSSSDNDGSDDDTPSKTRKKRSTKTVEEPKKKVTKEESPVKAKRGGRKAPAAAVSAEDSDEEQPVVATVKKGRGKNKKKEEEEVEEEEIDRKDQCGMFERCKAPGNLENVDWVQCDDCQQWWHTLCRFGKNEPYREKTFSCCKSPKATKAKKERRGRPSGSN